MLTRLIQQLLNSSKSDTPTDSVMVEASDAVWTVDAFTGRVLTCDSVGHASAWHGRVQRFDIAEYRHWCGVFELDFPASIDVLAIGYWLADGRYEPAESDARVDIVADLRQLAA